MLSSLKTILSTHFSPSTDGLSKTTIKPETFLKIKNISPSHHFPWQKPFLSLRRLIFGSLTGVAVYFRTPTSYHFS